MAFVICLFPYGAKRIGRLGRFKDVVFSPPGGVSVLVMPCYSPNRAALVTLPSGDKRISFKRDSIGDGIALPCGRCTGCIAERARQWAVRISHESQMSDCSSFITLTYDDKCLPRYYSLSLEDCQLFMKRLRSRVVPIKVRFFLAGEYGTNFGRPHYHAIIFGYDFPDKVPLEGKEGLYYSAELVDVWGKGHCSVGSVSFASASYVANYATKKIVGKEAKAHYGARKPEFVVMSRRPGIGASWINRFRSDVYPSDEVIVDGVSTRPPRFYDKVVGSLDKAIMEDVLALRVANAVELNGSLKDSFDAPRNVVRKAVADAKRALKSRKLE